MKTGTGLDGYDSASAVATRRCFNRDSRDSHHFVRPGVVAVWWSLTERVILCGFGIRLGICMLPALKAHLAPQLWLLHPLRHLYIAGFQFTCVAPQLTGAQVQNSEPQTPPGLELYVSCSC